MLFVRSEKCIIPPPVIPFIPGHRLTSDEGSTASAKPSARPPQNIFELGCCDKKISGKVHLMKHMTRAR